MSGDETFVVCEKTEWSSVAVGTQVAADALKRAKEMMRAGSIVSISDRSGNTYTLEEMERQVASGVYVKPASAAF